MRFKIIILAIGGALALYGCQSNAENKTASADNAANVINKPVNTVSNSAANFDINASEDAPKISERQIDQIKLGMSKAEVERIIGAGKPGKSLTDETSTGETYRWSIGGKTLVSITFEKGETADISQEVDLESIEEKK